MSFVLAAPELVQAAAQDLSGIRSTLAEASSSVAAPTTAVVPAAADEVSAAIAAIFGNFGQEYQFLSAQAQAFHAEFVNLLNTGASSYLSTEIANAEQSLLGVVNASVRGLLGQSIGAAAGTSGRAVGAVATSVNAVRPAAFPILGGLGVGTPGGSVLGSLGGGSLVPGLNGVVTRLESGSAFSLLSGQIGTSLQILSRDIAGLTGLGNSLAPGLLHAGAGTSLASVEGPYQTLYANTVANLQAFNTLWSANPAPFLHQFINNQIGYAHTIAAGIEYVIQNFPTVLANLPATIQAALQALANFNPGALLHTFINNQIGYFNIITTAFGSAAHDFTTGLMALPASFQSAFQALQAGDFGGAVSDVANGFVNLFVTGVDVTTTGNPLVAPGLIATVTPTGTLADLIPILSIPGTMGQNLTNALPVGSIPAQMAQNYTNVINTVTDTSITADALVTFRPIPPLNPSLSLTATFGLPVALVLDGIGAPVNALNAFGTSATAIVDAVQTGNLPGAAAAFIDAPAVIANGFLNGQGTLPITFDLSGIPATLNLPLDGLLVPQTAYTASVGPIPLVGTLTATVGGTPLSGLVTGLHNASEQLAIDIS